MNSKIRFLIAGAACIAAVALVRAQSQGAQAPSPAPDSQDMGPPPSQGHVWMAGHWNSEGGQWKWVAGHWDLPPSRSAVWVAGHWVQGNSGWVWMNGAWNVAEVPQSPDAPPMPPGQNGVPSPTTPAPSVQGMYSPQGTYAPGQVPVAYQGETVTDYPAIDYSYSYPGYYWDGAAWAWGFYPGVSLGLGWGWGPRFGGWGYYHGGGYGHWGHGGYAHGTSVHAGTGGHHR
jgi:hypothetical protein